MLPAIEPRVVPGLLRSVAQLVEQWSPKPPVAGSNPATPAGRLIGMRMPTEQAKQHRRFAEVVE